MMVAAALVAVPLLGYPALVAADGVRFPSAADCVEIVAHDDGSALDLVFGRRDIAADAEALLERVRAVGYVDAELRRDGCGRYEVLYDGITAFEQGLESRAEARGAGLEAELEREPPG